MWITNGLQADWMCLLANTREGPPHRNKSLICLPMDSKGITKTKITKIGNNASDTAQIFFDNVRVPRKNIIGEEGKGFTYQMLQFQEERMWGVASGTINVAWNLSYYNHILLLSSLLQFCYLWSGYWSAQLSTVRRGRHLVVLCLLIRSSTIVWLRWRLNWRHCDQYCIEPLVSQQAS